jgi:hypothetical protein
MTRLRSEGWSLRRIGDRFGITWQAVQQRLRMIGPRAPRHIVMRCHACGEAAGRMALKAERLRPVLCLPCLGRTPTTTFGQRLLAHRVAAGITIRDLALRTGVSARLLRRYELNDHRPSRECLARLAAVFGPGLVVPA